MDVRKFLEKQRKSRTEFELVVEEYRSRFGEFPAIFGRDLTDDEAVKLIRDATTSGKIIETTEDAFYGEDVVLKKKGESAKAKNSEITALNVQF